MATMKIRTARQYERALARLSVVMDRGNSVRELSAALSEYEEKHYPVPMPSIVEAVKFRMEQMRLKQIDMVPYFGSRSKVSEVLNGKRGVSFAMARRLYRDLGIPAKVLLQR